MAYPQTVTVRQEPDGTWTLQWAGVAAGFASDAEAWAWLDDQLSRMPWSRGLLPNDELAAWLASREEVGRAVDIKSCELGRWYADDCDPYGIREIIQPGYEWQQLGTNRFVRSPESRGWVWEGDLPTDKVRAMYDRIHREYEAWMRAKRSLAAQASARDERARP